MYHVTRLLEPPVVGCQHVDPVIVGREKPVRLSDKSVQRFCVHVSEQKLTHSINGSEFQLMLTSLDLVSFPDPHRGLAEGLGMRLA